jgi:ribosomal protein L12E/L44/L45/RPP1/RPP2
MVSKAWGKSHLLYIYAYYFIVAFGRKNVTKEDMLEVVRSLGTDTDEETAKEALAFIKARERAKEMLESRV